MNRTIHYDRSTGDYAMCLEGRLVGYRSTYHQAEVALDQKVYDILTHGLSVEDVAEVEDVAPALAA